jgi:ABC-type proline/glycine betaine transport system substrate-binding protein
MTIKKYSKNINQGWGCSSVVEHLLSMYQALGSISNTTTKAKTKIHNKIAKIKPNQKTIN